MKRSSVRFVTLFLIIFTISSQSMLYAKSRIDVLIPLGPSVIPFSTMMPSFSDKGLELNFTIWRSIDELVLRIRDKNYDLIIAPLLTLVNLYNKGMEIRYFATFNWASFYLVSREKLRKLEDLKGRTVYIAQKGSTQDIIFNIFLQEKGLKDTVNIYYSSPQEISSLFIANKIYYALLPEPFVSLCESSGGKIVLDLQRVYRELVGNHPLPITSICVRPSLDKKTLLLIDGLFREQFSLLRQDSSPFVDKSSEILKIDRNVLILALKRLMFRYRSFSSKNEILPFLRFIFDKESNLIDGKLPKDEFYI